MVSDAGGWGHPPHQFKLRLATAERLANCIALCCVVAWRVSWLAMLSRDAQTADPAAVFTEDERHLLDQATPDRKRQVPRDLQFYVRAVARLGGYLDRTSDAPPGTTVIWRGLSRLADLVEGARLATLTRHLWVTVSLPVGLRITFIAETLRSGGTLYRRGRYCAVHLRHQTLDCTYTGAPTCMSRQNDSNFGWNNSALFQTIAMPSPLGEYSAGDRISPTFQSYSSIRLLRTASKSGDAMKFATVRSPVVMITSAGMPAVRRPWISSGISASSTMIRAR